MEDTETHIAIAAGGTAADSHLGVTNRLLAPVAKRVFLAFPIPGRGAEAGRLLRRRAARKWIVRVRPVPAGTRAGDVTSTTCAGAWTSSARRPTTTCAPTSIRTPMRSTPPTWW